ncbi:hypothetical protein ABW19_dt0206614 [Dactylella cylindrospora]|nr:hypothetical protein ABW19_dt0206614 [Dactylella cylindrospora]
MRVIPPLLETLNFRKFRKTPPVRWGTFTQSLRDRYRLTPAGVETQLEEQPATSFGKKIPNYRRFKPTGNFSVYKMNEIQRTVENASFYKLVFFAPVASLARIKEAIFATGAGTLGNGLYTRCSFQTIGTGQFRPEIGSSPTIGKPGVTEVVEEIRCEIMCKGKKTAVAAVRALLHTHPYQAPAYEVYRTENGFLPHEVAVSPARRSSPPENARAELISRRISSQFLRLKQEENMQANPSEQANDQPITTAEDEPPLKGKL